MLKRLIETLIPLAIIVTAVLIFSFGIVLLVYLFLFIAAMSILISIISWIKRKFLSAKPAVKANKQAGRIIDADDWKKL